MTGPKTYTGTLDEISEDTGLFNVDQILLSTKDYTARLVLQEGTSLSDGSANLEIELTPSEYGLQDLKKLTIKGLVPGCLNILVKTHHHGPDSGPSVVKFTSPYSGSIKVVGQGNVEAVRDGDGDGDVICEGAGDFDAIREGVGNGNAKFEGAGYGDARRDGDGHGNAIRGGVGSGCASRSGAGKGDARREGDGSGDAYRVSAGDGDAVRSGAGKGSAMRSGTGNGDARREGDGKGKAFRYS